MIDRSLPTDPMIGRAPTETFVMDPPEGMRTPIPENDLILGRVSTGVYVNDKPLSEGDLDKLIKNGGPSADGKDLRNVPPDEYPTKYERAKGTFVEAMLFAAEGVDPALIEQAQAAHAQLKTLDINTASKDEMTRMVDMYRQLNQALYKTRSKLERRVEQFRTAFRLNGYRQSGSYSRETSSAYLGKRGMVHIVLPKEGLESRSDPNMTIWNSVLGGHAGYGSSVDRYTGIFYDATKTKVGEVKPVDREFLDAIRRPYLRLTGVKGDYSKYKPYGDLTPEHVERAGSRNAALEYAYIVRTTLVVALSEGDMPTSEDRRESRNGVAVNQNLGERFTALIADKATIQIGREIPQLREQLGQLRYEVGSDLTDALVAQAGIASLTRLTLSGLDPAHLDYSNWVVIDRQGNALYLQELLDRTIEQARQEGGKEKFLALAQDCKDKMVQMHTVCSKAHARGDKTQSGLVMSQDKIYSPVQLGDGSTWRVRSAAESQPVRQMWMDGSTNKDGLPFPYEAVAVDQYLSQVHGISVHVARDGMPATTREEFILMMRRTVAGQFPQPSYGGREQFHLDRTFGQTLKRVKELIIAERMVMPMYEQQLGWKD